MLKKHGAIAMILVGTFVTAGCGSKADPPQIEAMCKNFLRITGVSKSTDEEAEVERIKTEYTVKEDKLQNDIARDIKGQEDVFAQRKAELEKNAIELTEEEAKEGLTIEEKKEALLAKYTAEYEKNKKGFEEEFNELFVKIGPRRDREIEKAKIYVKDRKKKADGAMVKCVKEAETDGVSGDVANCRTAAKDISQYKTCN